MMSFLGSIQNLMKGSGIENLLIEVYAENTVNHIMSGKAVSGALHAFPHGSSIGNTSSEQVFDNDMIETTRFKEQLPEALQNSDIANKEAFLETELCWYVNGKPEKLKMSLSKESRSAKIWLLYIYYLDVLKRFIIAERTYNWSLHIDSTLRMLNLFVSYGHINYAKSARMYIQ